MKYKVCAVTGSRAEYGIMRPLLQKIKDSPHLDLVLAVTGSHLSAAFGETQNEILADGFVIDCRIPLALDNLDQVGMINATSQAMAAFGRYFSDNPPHLLIILGDRYEIFGVATAAAMLGISIAHLHGGETTEGAVDEFLRHSITKMSTLHFTACNEYRRRVIQLGEDPMRVFDVGALSVENAMNTPFMTLQELSDSLDIPLAEGRFCVVTYHPVTMEKDTYKEQLQELIVAMDQYPQYFYLITKSNADVGGMAINALWEEQLPHHPNWILVSSLGAVRYLSALRYAKAIIGNSSSGILEGPAMKLPTVNIGDRQKGRMLAESVINCQADAESIAVAMEQAFSPAFQQKAKHAINPFGGENISQNILDQIVLYLQKGNFSGKKSFYDWR